MKYSLTDQGVLVNFNKSSGVSIEILSRMCDINFYLESVFQPSELLKGLIFF